MAKNHPPRFLKVVDEARTRVTECSVADVKRRMDAGESLRVIDVREEQEYQAGHIPGAEWLGKGIIERDIERRIPDEQTELILYCGGGYRSALAADNLQKMGYENVISMDGGMGGWKEAGHPVET